MSQPPFTSRSLSAVANLAGEFAVNIKTEPLSFTLPANFDPEGWTMGFWFIPDWDNTDGLRHIIAQIRLDDDNVVTIEKDAAGDLTMTYVAQTQVTVISRTVAFSSGTPVFVGVAIDGNVTPSATRLYTYIAADQNGDDELEWTFKGQFGFPPDINRLAAGTYTLHVGSDFEFTYPLDGAVSLQITNIQDNTAIFDRFNGGDGLALVGSDSWIGRWCEYLVISISAEGSGNVRADTREGALDLMNVEDDGTGKLKFAIGDHDWVEFGDTDIFNGLTSGTWFFDFSNGQASAGHLLAGRFRLNGNNNRQWLASFIGQGELDFQINIEPSPGGENGNAHTTIRYATLNQRIAWIVTYDGSQPDDFGVTGKIRFYWAYYSSKGALGTNSGEVNPEQIWTPFKEVPTSDLTNTGTGPIPIAFKSAISATNYRWSSFDDQQGTTPLRGDFNDLRFNLNRALSSVEILAMNPSEFIRSQWTHRWGMKLNAAGEVPEDLGSGLDGELMSVSGDGPDEESDDSFRHGQFREVLDEGVFAFDGVDDLILTSDPGDDADIGLTRLSLPGDEIGSTGNIVSTPDDAAFDVLVGDLDLRIDIRRDAYSDSANQFNSQLLIGKVGGGSGDRTFDWSFQSFMTLRLTVYDTTGNAVGDFSTAELLPKFLDGKRIWLRVTMERDDGAGNRVAKFYYSQTWDGVSADDGETWVLHETRSFSGVISNPLDGSPGSDMNIGAHAFNLPARLRADVFRAQVRDGIEGTIVWDPNFEGEAPGTTSFSEDANGLTVTINQVGDPQAEITNGLSRVTWGWWGRIGRISAVVETIFGRWDGIDNQFRIARNGADIRVYISSGGSSEDDFVDFTLGMEAGQKWKFIVTYAGSGAFGHAQNDPPKGVRVTLYAYLFDPATGQWGSRQTPTPVVTGILPQTLVPSALGYVWANGDFAGEVDETRVWNDAILDALEADQETVYQTI